MVLLCLGLPLAAEAGDDTRDMPAPYGPPPAPEASDWPDKRLRGLMRDLTGFVHEHHLVTDQSRPVYGMTYEFFEDGRKIQAFGLDTMHDGAWFASALLAAHRAAPEAGYLSRARRDQIPFYTNVINHSDKLFAKKKRRKGQDKKPLQEPLKGWVPRGWDDGLGYDRKTGKRFGTGQFNHADRASIERTEDGRFKWAYDVPSNHLAQDLVDMMLNVWLTTGNPRAAEAARHVHAYRTEYFRSIPTIEKAVAYMGEAESTPSAESLSGFAPGHARTYHGGLYGGRKARIPVYDDPLAWAYRRATGHYVRRGRFPPAFAWDAAWRVYEAAMTTELFFDTGDYRPGLFLFHRLGINVDPATGGFTRYRSDGQTRLGTRGVQLAWTAAGVLPVLREHPDVWARPYHENHDDAALVRMVDRPPKTDGRRDAVYERSDAVEAGPGKLRLISDPENLHVWLRRSDDGAPLTLRIGRAGEDTPDRHATITLKPDGSVMARNNKGEALLHDAAVADTDDGGRSVELRIPYSVMPQQEAWINGVDHGLYRITINGDAERRFYILSRPQRIIRRLEDLALGAVATWHEVWREHGYLPGAVYAENLDPTRHWGRSELGGYAHLIHTMAMILIDRADQTEWRLIERQRPDEPENIPTLPDSVLKAQGLK